MTETAGPPDEPSVPVEEPVDEDVFIGADVDGRTHPSRSTSP